MKATNRNLDRSRIKFNSPNNRITIQSLDSNDIIIEEQLRFVNHEKNKI